MSDAATRAKFSLPPRSLESFGVVGLLSESCRIHYGSIFSARHIGRVSDLLAAQIKRLAPLNDELRLRTALLFSLHEAYRCQLLALQRDGGEILPEPLIVECGIDDEKIAVGVSFSLPADLALDAGALRRKIPAGQAENRVESFIARIFADSDQVVVRIEGRTRRIEVVSLIALAQDARAAPGDRPPFEVVMLRPNVRISPLKAQYIELGDLDYARLLSEDAPSLKDRPATGEILAASPGTGEDVASIRVGGRKGSKEEITRISGVTQHLGGDDTRIELHQQRIAQPQAEIADAEAQADAPGVSIQEIIRNLWPFSRGRGKKKEQAAPPLEQASPSPQPTPEAAPPADAGPSPADASDPSADKLLQEQVEKLQGTIEKIQTESEALKKELGNGRARKWAEGMVGELLSGKAQLNELSKKLGVAFRQKEFELRNRETALQEELRRKDEQLRQKSFALERAKEQLSQATGSLERSRAAHSTASEETQYRQRFLLTQKLMAAAKEESVSLSRRLEETRGQLAVAQSAAKARLQKDLDYDTLRSKHERLLRQSEEFRRANRQLVEKLGELERQQSGGNPEELKRKLEAAMRLAATHQTDSELLRAKVEEVQKSEARLKAEIQRVSTALRALKASQAGGGGGGSEAA